MKMIKTKKKFLTYAEFEREYFPKENTEGEFDADLSNIVQNILDAYFPKATHSQQKKRFNAKCARPPQ